MSPLPNFPRVGLPGRYSRGADLDIIDTVIVTYGETIHGENPSGCSKNTASQTHL